MTRLAVACFLLVAGACTQPAQVLGATPDAGAAAPLVAALSPPEAVDAGPLTAPAQPSDGGQVVRFVALGDTGHGNADQTRVGDAVGALCAEKGCDFVVLLGDNFYPTGVTSTNDPQWLSSFVKPYAKVDAPFYAVLGNHDYGGNGSGNEIDKAQPQIDYSKLNPKWRMPAAHYRFTVRDVDFFVADTNRSMYSLDDQARADFERWLPESKATWKIVFGHHTYKSNGRHGNAGNYEGLPSLVPVASGRGVKSFLEEEVCGRADAYLCGHEHVLEWLKSTCARPDSTLRTELLISGGGSSFTGFAKEARDPYYWHAAAVGFTYVVIDGKTFTGTYFDRDGTVLFSRSFTKP